MILLSKKMCKGDYISVDIRYIRDHLNGSDVNEYSHWVEIQAYSNAVNVALGKTVTSDSLGKDKPLSVITDGEYTNLNLFFEPQVNNSYVQVDLGSIFDVSELKIWHYTDRTYTTAKTEVSIDGTNWTTVFDATTDGAYFETSAGHSILLPEPDPEPTPTSDISNVKLGNTQVNKIYVGENISWIYEVPDTTPPVTTPYPTSTVSYNAGREIYFEVNETCFTYYTLDGSPVTTNSTLYTAPIVLNENTTINYFSVDLAGNAETPKTVTYTITAGGEVPITYISPSVAIQNTIPITVNLTRSILEATTYYKIGTGAQQTFTAPFAVNQDTAGVGSTQIPITYWTVSNLGATEAQRTLTYDTSGAIPAKAVVTATPASYYVYLQWSATANTTSYNVYRSTVSGQLGTLVSEYQTGVMYEDIYAQNGTTYYYTVRSANYGRFIDSDPVSATPSSAPAPTGWQYVRFVGHGDNTSATTRLVELQALEGATNRLLNKLPMAGYAATNGGAIAVATDGAKVQSSGYPLWWSGEGIPDLHYDMGAKYPIDTINVTGFSSAVDPRQTQFKIYVSNDNTNWTLVQDYSLNTTPQPVDGFYFTVPAS
jgi:hypothetical protein